jgi:Tfp pilus assembly protein PilO
MTGRSRAWRWWSVDLAGLACCAVLAGAGYMIAVVPVVRSREAVASLRSSIGGVEANGEQLLQITRTLDLELARVQSRLRSSSLELEPAERVNRRVNELTRLASESGLTLDEVLPRAPEEGSMFRTVPIHISGAGSFPDCARFVHSLRSELPDTTVESLRLVGGAETGTFEFDLVWYAAPADRGG